jgi:hypothetical protein
MFDPNLLENVRYVIDSKGKKAAVQVDVKAWDALLAYLEDLEDQALVKDKLAQLRKGPQASGAVIWDDVSPEWYLLSSQGLENAYGEDEPEYSVFPAAD